MVKTRKVKSKIYIKGNKDKCIFVSLMAGEGLGNQLFIYAAGLTIQENTHLPICMLKDTTNPHSKVDYRNLFDLVKIDDTPNIKQRIHISKNVMSSQRGFTNKWDANTISYNKSRDSNKNIKIPYSLYQNYKSIHKIIPKMKHILEKNEFNKDKYNEFKDIKPLETAFMHVRRGDKIARGENHTHEYYSKGLVEFEKNKNIKKIYVFSNDINWCKGNDSEWKKHTTKELIYYDNPDELIILYMMIRCTAGAILSNSTFGMWGAILGADMNPQSTILYNLIQVQYHGKKNPMDFPERWIGI